jgi:hypothetical protein
MVVPFFPGAPALSALPLHLLLAPTGQLSGDGQLRELMAERRQRCHGSSRGTGPIWYLSAAQVSAQGIGIGLGFGKAALTAVRPRPALQPGSVAAGSGRR